MSYQTLKRPSDYAGQFFTDFPTRAAYSQGAGPYRIVPEAVAIPASVPDIVSIIGLARAENVSIIPRGAGSGMPGGNIGRGIIVDLHLLNRPVFVSADHVANVGSAATYTRLQAAAEHLNLRLPPDPSSGAFCTIGGMVATNAAGASSLKHGSIRRWVRGVEIVTADGELGWIGRSEIHRRHRMPRASQKICRETLSATQRFVEDVAPSIQAATETVHQRFPKSTKNSAGYALDAYLATGDILDLIIGSEGTLGLITRVELDLDIVPAATSCALLGLHSINHLPEVVECAKRLDAVCCDFLDRTYLARSHIDLPLDAVDAVVLVGFESRSEEGARGLVGDLIRGTQTWCAQTQVGITPEGQAQIWSIRHAASPTLARLPRSQRSLQIVEDGCVPPNQLGRYLEFLRHAATECNIDVVMFGHAGDGHVHVNALADLDDPTVPTRLSRLLEMVTDQVLVLGGTVSGEHGDGRLRTGPLVQQYGPEIISLFRRVKQAFDPLGIMNPGVILADAHDPSPMAHLKGGAAAASIPAEIDERLLELERSAGWSVSKVSLV